MPKILVVDDDQGVREILQRLLASLGEIVLAANGAEALEMIERRVPDVVVTSIQMPVIGGIKLREIVADALPRIRFVFLAGNLDELEEAKKTGERWYLELSGDFRAIEHLVIWALEDTGKEVA